MAVHTNERRRQDLADHTTLNGIDSVEVLDRDALDALGKQASAPVRQRTLFVRLFKPVQGLSTDNVAIEGGVRVTDVAVVWARPANAVPASLVPKQEERAIYSGLPAAQNVLVVRTDRAGDYSPYTARLVKSASTDQLEPPPGFDSRLSSATFSFKAECASDFDCGDQPEAAEPQPPEPAIDYLAKDYASFRRLMLDRLSALVPGWSERNPADAGVMAVEALAYAADSLSYFQDAVATEAYLGTARRRVSVRRHARLLDYRMHEGCNARAWVHIHYQPAGAATDTLPEGTLLLTRSAAQPGRLPEQGVPDALAKGAVAFETLHEVELDASRNGIAIHAWGDEEFTLPAGATSAALRSPAQAPLAPPAPGDVLIFEEVLSPHTGQAADADPAKRHPVRLTRVAASSDPLYSIDLYHVDWEAEDALPFELTVSHRPERQGSLLTGVTVARGNVVLADHGMTLPDEELEDVAGEDFRPHLSRPHVTHRIPYAHSAPGRRPPPARSALLQDPRRALPVVALIDQRQRQRWEVAEAGDLLSSGRFDQAFVVELEDDGRAQLRFGDGEAGRRPPRGASLMARYRVGNGSAGNVGAEAIANVVTPIPGIRAIRNPLPAQGGTDPEPVEAVRISAPQAFRRQERAVTEQDWATAAEAHPEVQRAAATRRWTGSWQTVFVTVDRRGGRPVDAAFREEIADWLDRHRLAAQELEVDAPRFVALDIAFTICVEPDHLRGTVRAALAELFSNRDLAGGRRGLFHPDSLTFGQPVYLSPLVAAAMSVPGVLWVDTDDTPPKPNRFRRRGEPSSRELLEGVVRVGRLEIARLDNDPNAPENGSIEFHLTGGL